VQLPSQITREVVGRRRELRLLLTAVERGKAVLLVGLPGVSKTTIVRAVAAHLGGGTDSVVDVTGDEQMTAHGLVGTFDPPLVLKDGYRSEHFVPGPLARAMTAGGILYLEELNRAPSGALNVLMTALSERYLEVPRLGRVDAAAGFTVIGAANPLDDVGTARLSRGLADRFLLLPLDYQPRDEEIEIVRRRCGMKRAGFHPFAVDVARESRGHPDLRHGASVRGAIDMVDLLAGWAGDELDLETLRYLGCTAYGGKLRVRPAASRSACEIVDELIDAVLRRDYAGSFETLLEHAAAAPAGQPAHVEGEDRATIGEEGETALAGGGDRQPEPSREPDEIPGLSRPGGGAEPGESRSVPMVERDRPSPSDARLADLTDHREVHLRDPEVPSRRAEQHAGGPLGGGDGIEGDLARGDTQRLHHRVRREQPAADECAQPGQARARVLGGHRIDEVLHRVGRHDLAVVPFCVRVQEALAEDVDVHGRRERPRAPTGEAVEDDVRFAVADFGRHARTPPSRSRAMARNSSIPVPSSWARVRARRARSTGTSSVLDRPLTKTTNRKPNRSS